MSEGRMHGKRVAINGLADIFIAIKIFWVICHFHQDIFEVEPE